MAISAGAVEISSKQQDSVIMFAQVAQQLLQSQMSFRSVLETIDRTYMREVDFSADTLLSKAFNRAGDPTKIQNVTVPIVMPQVEAAIAYMQSVFLSGDPIFPVNSTPENQKVAKQIEAIFSEQERTARWKRQLSMFFRDGLKYNLHALEVSWETKKLPGVISDSKNPGNTASSSIEWQGNVIRRLDLYNTFFDPRVHPAELFEHGEFAGYNEFYSRVRMKQYMNNMSKSGAAEKGKVLEALNSTYSGASMTGNQSAPFGYYIPSLNPEVAVQKNGATYASGMNWTAWAEAKAANTGIRYSSGYIVTTLYAKIIPTDFGFLVPERNTPQVWKFIIINGSVVVCAERLSNFHGHLPIFFGQPIEDGLDYQTKSFAKNAEDLQRVASALWSGVLASKRRLVGDRVLYDPMRIRASDMNNPDPAAKIPVRPSAMGTPVGDSVHQFPFRDEPTNSLLSISQAVTQFANTVNGQNAATQGQFVKGNKSVHEYQDTMGHSNDRNVSMALTTEQQVFTPLKYVLLMNVLQYQQAGALTHPTDKQTVQIDPEALRKTAIQFVISDGLTPADKEMSTEAFGMALQVLGSSPQLGQGYNMAPLFSHLMSLQGVDLTPFEKPPEQLQYEQQMGVWQQAAAQAAQAKAPFNTPMPQPPQPKGPGASAQTAAVQQTTTP